MRLISLLTNMSIQYQHSYESSANRGQLYKVLTREVTIGERFIAKPRWLPLFKRNSLKPDSMGLIILYTF